MILYKISIIMPVHNNEKYIGQAIESILGQKGVDLELIIVDNMSTDLTIKIVKEYKDPRIKIVHESRKGVSFALNKGLESAQGNLIARCDSDDLYAENRLKMQLDFLEKNPAFGAICSNFSAITKKGELITHLKSYGEKSREVTSDLKNGVALTSLCTFLIRAELVKNLKGWRTFFVCAEDIDMQFRLSASCRIWYMSKVLYFARIHNSSLTHSQSKEEQKFFIDFVEKFRQQRLENGKDDLDLGMAAQIPQFKTYKKCGAIDRLNDLFIVRAWEEYKNNNIWRSILITAKTCVAQPMKFSRWKNLLILTIKIIFRKR